LKQLKTVLQFEYNSYIKNKVFLILTALLAAAVIIGINAPNISNLIDSFRSGDAYEDGATSPSDEARDRAIIYDPLGHFTNQILNDFFPNTYFVRPGYFDADTFEEKIASGEYEFALSVRGLDYTLIRSSGGIFDFSLHVVPGMVRHVYQTRAYEEFGLEQDQITRVQDASPRGAYITVGRDLMQTFWVGYVMLILLYMTIQFYGQFVMTSVVTEKSSKAMELLITSVKPIHLMFGKVFGSGLAGLTQLILLLVSAVAMFQLTASQWEEFSPTVAGILGLSLTFDIVAYALIFFVLGFFMFAFLYAGFGSTVSRMEDANKVIMVPMMLFMASFFIAMFGGMNDPESTFYVAASFIPFLSPMVMFMRICLTGVPMVQILIAIAINVVSVIGVGILCAKIYRAGVLMYGKPMSVIEIFKQLVKA